MSDPRPGELVVAMEMTSGGRYTIIFHGGRRLDVPKKVYQATGVGDRWPGMERREPPKE